MLIPHDSWVGEINWMTGGLKMPKQFRDDKRTNVRGLSCENFLNYLVAYDTRGAHQEP